jgi:hypothetical protein
MKMKQMKQDEQRCEIWKCNFEMRQLNEKLDRDVGCELCCFKTFFARCARYFHWDSNTTVHMQDISTHPYIVVSIYPYILYLFRYSSFHIDA